MIRFLLIAVFLLAGCSPGRREEPPAAEEVPIGPGSDSTTLRPPDTPMSRREPMTPTTTTNR